MRESTPSSDFERYERVRRALGITDYSRQIIHYTSLSAFKQILSSQELWFGDVATMNDTAECVHFIDAVRAQAPRFLVGSDVPGVVQLIEGFRSAVRDRTYVSSWCEYSDDKPDGQLGMWRGYADGGEGVGIVVDSSQFQPSELKPQALDFHVMMSKVEYVAKDQVVELAKDYFRRLSSIEFLQSAMEEKSVLATLLLLKAPCVKHVGFHEEEEVRFLFQHGLLEATGRSIPGVKLTQVEGRPGRTFFALALRNYPEFGFDLSLARILKKIVVGPAGDRAARAREVRQILNAHGLSHVAVSESEIPFRGVP